MFPLRISGDETAGLKESGQKTSTKTALSSLKEVGVYKHHEDERTLCRRLPSTLGPSPGEKVDAADRDHTPSDYASGWCRGKVLRADCGLIGSESLVVGEGGYNVLRVERVG